MTPDSSTTARLWHMLRDQGYAAVQAHEPQRPDDAFYAAVLAFGHDDYARAAALAGQAALGAPGNQLYAAARSYLGRVAAEGKPNVYLSADAFGAFIRGGGNIPLYDAASAALREVYQEARPERLLDIGVGDGRALIPALVPGIHEITLVEPAAGMLSETLRLLAERQIAARAFPVSLQSFTENGHGRWDIAQATWSFQSVPPDDRPAMLRWLRKHTKRLLIAEFDPPQWDDMYDPAFVRSVAERFEHGIGEYEDDRELVTQGFLMPVMFGYFDQTAARTNYEQPIQAWSQQLQDAGFAHVSSSMLYPYWWATAYLLDARA